VVTDDLWTCHLGRVEYREAAELQERLRERVIAGELPDLVLLLEHPPVYTLGRRSEPSDLPLSEEFLRGRGIDVVKTPRGGKLTYHAPGQLVGYPIMHVPNVVDFVHSMQRAIAAALGEAGIEATTREGREYTGVWVGERKIASIGIHLSHGVSSHGFAVNVENEMAPFEWAVACGLPGVRMTSMQAEGSAEGVACFRKRVGHAFARELGRRQRLVSAQRLHAMRPNAAYSQPQAAASALA
jgi:lipoate-protein ligase B